MHERGHAEILTYPPVGLHGAVVDGFASGNEIACDLRMPISELQRIPRTKPIRAAGLNTGAFSPDPAPDDVVLVGVKIVVEAIVINVLPSMLREVGVFVFTASTRKSSLDMPGTLDR